jgi:hypothetical protein
MEKKPEKTERKKNGKKNGCPERVFGKVTLKPLVMHQGIADSGF